MKSYRKIFVLLALLSSTSSVFAGDLSVTVGLKAWANEWQTWNDPRGTALGSGSFGTANAVAINPSVTIKYKNAFMSAGFMPSTSYKIPGSSDGTTSNASRKEMDLSVGYYFHPQAALTLGYKQITQTWGGADYVWKIPAMGISTFAPVQDTSMFIYGNGAVGISTITTSDSTASTWSMKGGMYTTSEIGAGYSFSSSFRVTGGYKFQASPTTMESRLTTKKITFIDSTRGFVFGGSFTF